MRITSFLLIMLFSCKSKTAEKPLDCTRFKKGQFVLNDKLNRTRYIVTRNLTAQTEVNENTDTVTSYKIKWINDCHYELRKISVMKRSANDSGSVIPVESPDIMPLLVEIVATGINYCVFKAWKKDHPYVYSDTMWIAGRIGGFKPMGGIYSVEK